MGVIQLYVERFMNAAPRNFHLGWFQKKSHFGKTYKVKTQKPDYNI